MSLIDAKNLTVRLDGHEILTNVSIRIEAGEIVTILGPNGSGKSTLLRTLLRILPVAEGEVTQAKNLRVGYVPQRLAVDRSMPMTVRRFLSLPLWVGDADAAAALRQVGVPEVTEQQLTELSGGQFQRVLLARALLARPQLLMLDEPTQGLDQPGKTAFYQLIKEIRRETGAAVLMISHDLHAVMAASDRVIYLNGHICCEGTPQIVSTAPEYHALFGFGLQGTLALYRHAHDNGHTELVHHNHAEHGHA